MVFAVVQSEIEVLEINLGIAAEELTKFEAVSDELVKAEKTLSDESDTLAAARKSNQTFFEREKAIIQDKHTKLVSVRPVLSILLPTPLFSCKQRCKS